MPRIKGVDGSKSIKSAKAQKGSTQMSEETKAPGREAKYKLDVEAAVNAGAVLESIEISGKDKEDENIEHKVSTNVFKGSDLSHFLNLFGNDEAALYDFLSGAVTAYVQRPARAELAEARQGISKLIEKNTKSLKAGGFTDATAQSLGCESVEAFVRKQLGR